ncbi:hypothetical protein LUX01_12700 [Streptomyces sudanensis]|uniref:hypothetical protein n=1 Tax=Streptomyces sudanensis TaxID=436397 RepID=UPI0020CC56B0|nr:hypothetical protein [Streptomyces sudanensis]MCP9987428.1 hypothetical protein [Streptomyces sudanensis]
MSSRVSERIWAVQLSSPRTTTSPPDMVKPPFSGARSRVGAPPSYGVQSRSVAPSWVKE